MTGNRLMMNPCKTRHRLSLRAACAVFVSMAITMLFPLLAHADPIAQTEVLADNLEHPWALAFIGGGRMLVTERPGRMRLVQPRGEVGPPIKGLPKIDVGGQGGLHDVVADSGFA